MEKIKLHTLLELTEASSLVSIRNDYENYFANGAETYFEGEASNVPYWLINREVAKIEPFFVFESDKKTFREPMIIVYVNTEQ